MMLEAFVITLCTVGGSGCSESTAAISKQNEDIQYVSTVVNNYGQKISSDQKWLVYTAAPLYVWNNKRIPTVQIYKGTSLSMSRQESALHFKWNF